MGLHNHADVWVDGDKEVEKIKIDYFENLFATTIPEEFDGILANVSERTSERDNEMITRRATEPEVKAALFMMNPEKAPGPDGMTVLFFQRSWHILKEDVVKMVNEFFTT